MMIYFISNIVIGFVLFWVIRRVIHRMIDRKKHQALRHLVIPLRHQKHPHAICLSQQDKLYGIFAVLEHKET